VVFDLNAIDAARKEIAARLMMAAMVRHLCRFDNADLRTSHLFVTLAGLSQLHTCGDVRRHFAMTPLFTRACEPV
jgi:hypothetical protein